MDPVRWQRVKDLFELGEPMTPIERDAMLAKEPDEEVRQEAARLLAANPSDAFIDQPAVSPDYLDRIASSQVTLLADGEMLGARYKIEKRVGSGGMGEVYSAWDSELRERIAIKTLRLEVMANPGMMARFRREITLARRVSHPNVCRVFDLSTAERSSDHERVDFLTMELVEGETLAQMLKREAPMAFPAARPLLEQICAGLAAAHDAGVVHRDFKGSNVLIAKRADGSLRVAVTDFGLARSVSLEGMSQSSSTGLAGGTPAYMSPEQMEGQTVGPKADLYALGIVMYEMATGTSPHKGDSPLQIAVQRVTQPPPAPRTVKPDVEEPWEAAILQCLEYKPEDRPADARAVAAMFGHPPPLFTVPRWRMPASVWPAVAGAAVAALLAAWLWMRPPSHSEDAMRWYRKGMDSLLDGSYSTARASFEEALRVEPGFGVARARLADTYYELDLRNEAKVEAGKAASGDRDEGVLIDGIRLALQSKISEAVARMDTLVARKHTVESLLDRARILDRGDRMAEAIGGYESALKRDPALPGALLRLSVLLDATGKKKESLEALGKAEAEYVKFGNLEGRAAVALEKAKRQEKMESAEGLAREARLLASQAGSSTLQVRAIFAESAYAAQRGDTGRAEALAAEAMALGKSQGQTSAVAVGLEGLAYVAYAKRDYKQAAIGYREALDVAERDGAMGRAAKIRRSLGDSMARGGRIDEGMKFIEQARGYHEANGDVLEALRDRLMLADCEAMAERHDIALQMQKQTLAEATKTPGGEMLARRIRLSLIQGSYTRGEYPDVISIASEALADYQSSGERPKEMFVRPYLAGSLRHLGRLAEARVVLTPALADSSNPFLPLAKPENLDLLRDEGNLEQAISTIELAVKRAGKVDPDSDEARNLCMLYAISDHPLKAEHWCERLNLITPESSHLTPRLKEAMFTVQTSEGNWAGAMTTARKLVAWTDAHRDPEIRLLAQLLIAVASSEAGKKACPQELAANWTRERERLESLWGKGAVAGMLSLPSFKRYQAVISEIDSRETKERKQDGNK